MERVAFVKANFDRVDGCSDEKVPVIHIISDSLGETATEVVNAAAAQFPAGAIRIERLAKVDSADQVRHYFDKNADPDVPTAVFHTIVNSGLRSEVRRELDRHGIPSIDLLGPAISVLSTLTGLAPKNIPGAIHNVDMRYLRRAEAMEFFVNHDDGHNPGGLTDADIVLVGVSRTSKTPLSMYLSFLGYKVANVPLALGVEPPAQLEDVEKGRVFGLVAPSSSLASVRQSRLSDDAAFAIAGSYADPQEIDIEQDGARKFMDKLGCKVIHTEGKAVEEIAAEIIEHIEALGTEA